MDHHYVPQFYLKQWANPDGRIPSYRWINGRAAFSHIKSTKGTGYEPDLYAREHVPPEERHKVETDFFTVLDNKAAIIHGRLIRQERFTFTAEERHDWAIFLAATPSMKLARLINESVFNRAAERVYGRTSIEYAQRAFSLTRQKRQA